MCVLGCFWLIYVAPDFPQPDRAVLCRAPRSKEFSLISLPTFRDSHEPAGNRLPGGTPTPARSPDKHVAVELLMHLSAQDWNGRNKSFVNNKSQMNVNVLGALGGFLREQFIGRFMNTNASKDSGPRRIGQSHLHYDSELMVKARKRRLPLRLQLFDSKTAPAAESVSSVGPR